MNTIMQSLKLWACHYSCSCCDEALQMMRHEISSHQPSCVSAAGNVKLLCVQSCKPAIKDNSDESEEAEFLLDEAAITGPDQRSAHVLLAQQAIAPCHFASSCIMQLFQIYPSGASDPPLVLTCFLFCKCSSAKHFCTKSASKSAGSLKKHAV